ncbi:MAG: replication-associated recombination protein A [Opitutales bacterium]
MGQLSYYLVGGIFVDLFNQEIREQSSQVSEGHKPLAARMRPRSLKEIAGQEHLLGEDCLLPKLIRSNNFGSILLYGPPGSGKTSLAEVIAAETQSKCVRLNAVLSNVAELRDVLRLARYQATSRTVVFIDEIHRFNKAQQDLLLPDVETGNIRLIGATTHNPGFYVNAPLLSRSHLFHLEPLSEEVIVDVLKEALVDEDRGLGSFHCTVKGEQLLFLAKMSDGDLRRALNALETIILSKPMGSALTEDDIRSFAEERQIRYDADEDEHYDTISAFIKSVRGSDPDAALYWLAKMLEGGEDPRFVARRLVILASEDVGLADSRALPLAVATFQACEQIGMPECALNLGHATVFLATAPKSNSAYLGINAAREAIRKEPVQPIPLWIRGSSGSVARALGHGKGYEYSHDAEHGITGQDYMKQPIQFYFPKEVGAEVHIAERLAFWKDLKASLKRKK